MVLRIRSRMRHGSCPEELMPRETLCPHGPDIPYLCLLFWYKSASFESQSSPLQMTNYVVTLFILCAGDPTWPVDRSPPRLSSPVYTTYFLWQWQSPCPPAFSCLSQCPSPSCPIAATGTQNLFRDQEDKLSHQLQPLWSIF